MPVMTMRALALTALAVAAGSMTSEAAPPNDYSFRVIATLSTPAPGGATHVGDFEPQDINSRGDVAFASDLADESGANFGEGLYARSHGTTRLIARANDPIPGTGLTYGPGIYSPAGMNDAGDIAFGFAPGVFRYDAAKNRVSPVVMPGDVLPGGIKFRESWYHTDLNNRSQIATALIIETPDGHCTDPKCLGLGRAVYSFDRFNRAAKIAAPGDRAPGSTSIFDDAWDPNLNNRGDIIFGGHVKGEECFRDKPSDLGCYESLYLYRASTRRLLSLVHHGDPAPGGGTFKLAFNGRLNDGGDASFIGTFQGQQNQPDDDGVFLRRRDGTLFAVARTGDNLPGGTMKHTTFNQGSHAIDNAGNIAFAAQLDADINGDGIEDTGVYLRSGGTIRTVVKTGTVIPGVGTVEHVNNAYWVGVNSNPWPAVHLTESGEILTQVIVKTANGQSANHVVVATPKFYMPYARFK